MLVFVTNNISRKLYLKLCRICIYIYMDFMIIYNLKIDKLIWIAAQ